MKKSISNVLAVIWFFGVFIWAFIIGLIRLFISIIPNVLRMIGTGYAVKSGGFVLCFVCAVVFFLTMIVPVFRKCYYKLPWLYPASIILLMDLFIFSIAEFIMEKGFSVMSVNRHVLTVFLVLIQIVVCRAVMSVYLKKYPLVLRASDRLE